MGSAKPRSPILSEHKAGLSPGPPGSGATTTSLGNDTNGTPAKDASKPSSSPNKDPPPPGKVPPAPPRPRHPQYADLQSRLDSFVAWPYRVVRQDPRRLALCGFFYIGSADRVRCFSCGSTLRNWEPGDSPHREHRTWAPACPFIAATPEPSTAAVEALVSPVPLTTTPPAPTSTSTNPPEPTPTTTPTPTIGTSSTSSITVADSTPGNAVVAREATVAKDAAVAKDVAVAKDAAPSREGGAAGGCTVIAMEENADQTSQQTPRDAQQTAAATTTSAREESSGAAVVTDVDMETPVVLAVLEMGVARLKVQEAIRRRLASSQGLFPSAGDLFLAAEAVAVDGV